MSTLIGSIGSYAWIAIVGLVVALIVVVICMFVSYYNKFVKGRNSVDESFSTMDVYLKKRYDLIPNLVSTVKGYGCKFSKSRGQNKEREYS